jgi:hypothetical protein
MTVWPAEIAGTNLGQTIAVVAAAPGNGSGNGGGAPGGRGEEFGKSSPMALLLIVLLGLAVVLLIRSMTKHLKRVPASFDPEPEQESDSAAGGSGSGTAKN